MQRLLQVHALLGGADSRATAVGQSSRESEGGACHRGVSSEAYCVALACLLARACVRLRFRPLDYARYGFDKLGRLLEELEDIGMLRVFRPKGAPSAVCARARLRWPCRAVCSPLAVAAAAAAAASAQRSAPPAPQASSTL